MISAEGDISNFENAVICHICDKGFNDEDRKVRDHCHSSGKSRGAAYNSCYLKFNKPKKISVIFHNLSGYDAHLFIRRSSDGNDEGIFYIASTEETYISFTKKDHQ